MKIEDLLKLNKDDLTRTLNGVSPQALKTLSEEATKKFDKLYNNLKARIDKLYLR